MAILLAVFKLFDAQPQGGDDSESDGLSEMNEWLTRLFVLLVANQPHHNINYSLFNKIFSGFNDSLSQFKMVTFYRYIVETVLNTTGRKETKID